MTDAEERESGCNRRLIYAPFALLLLWGVLGWAIWREGWTRLNQALLVVIALWSTYRLVTFFRGGKE